ncbi:aminotransferase class I/II-fold pyridoxal phosphate-dependent enzyme, partial [Helicobacter pylori]
LNSPNNPTGRTLSLEELISWVKLALKHDFILINDECYSEIYENAPPPSLLEACMLAGNGAFKNVLVIHSLSKRSSA